MARTKGAVSCVEVTLDELMEHFGPSAIIPVNARFARANNLQGKAAYATRNNINAAGDQPEAIEITES